MRLLSFPWLLLLAFLQLLLRFDRTNSRCLDDQSSSLLQLKDTLLYNHSTSLKLMSWNRTTNCCSWKGVTCDQDEAHVTGLDLSGEFIGGGINSSSTLFNLSYSDFSGQVPIEISRLTSLVSLNLSNNFDLQLQNPDLKTLVRNLSRLIELCLDGVNISAKGSEWSQALSSALPRLQVLSLSNCYLSGPPDASLLKLRSLSEIRLGRNNISQVPEFFTNFSRLTTLSLYDCGLTGKFPERIFQLSTLRDLDLSFNEDLQGSLPEFPQNGSLQTLVVTGTSFYGKLPESIGNLKLLLRLDLSYCNFSGSIPSTLSNLAQLNYLDFSRNRLNGQIPSFKLPNNLTYIDLSHCKFSGSIPSTLSNLAQLNYLDFSWNRLNGQIPSFKLPNNLTHIDLSVNRFNGTIPPSLFALPLLQSLDLSYNHLSGQLVELTNASSSPLEILNLCSNNLVGPIPNSLFDLKNLNFLSLSFNKLNGTLCLDRIFQNLRNLPYLDLSHNELSVNANSDNSTFSSSLRTFTFKLASCNLSTVPAILKDQSHLDHLDLSNNQIHGLIPNWIWKINLMYLNLSYNFLVSLELPFPDLSSSSIFTLDLHNNMLQGLITPLLPPSAVVLDLSNNNFTSEIPANISSYLNNTSFLSLAGNKFVGEIPTSICSTTRLKLLDLSSNNLSGQIPQCLGRLYSLTVLNLGWNNFSGIIPQIFSSMYPLETLDLSGNMLGGQIPRSLVKCKMLKVLNIGNNQIYDTFPLWLGNLRHLQVLVLRFNRFYGTFGFASTNNKFPMLKIIDLSSNNFTGVLSPKSFLSWKGMVVDEDESQSKLEPGILKHKLYLGYYQDSVTISIKGREMKLVKIVTVFSSFDLSSNRFQGEIPEVIGNLTLLHVLNLSHNSFTGEIPSSIGNLKQMESLDLSRNKLKGKIPMELVKLTFLSVLNVSWNQLVGMIPQGNQFQTFSNDSFIGNVGLCGLPLSKKCVGAASPPTSMSEDSNSKSHKKFNWWQFSSAGIGYIAGAGLVFVSLMLWKKGKKWYNEHIEKCF